MAHNKNTTTTTTTRTKSSSFDVVDLTDDSPAPSSHRRREEPSSKGKDNHNHNDNDHTEEKEEEELAPIGVDICPDIVDLEDEEDDETGLRNYEFCSEEFFPWTSLASLARNMASEEEESSSPATSSSTTAEDDHHPVPSKQQQQQQQQRQQQSQQQQQQQQQQRRRQQRQEQRRQRPNDGKPAQRVQTHRNNNNMGQHHHGQPFSSSTSKNKPIRISNNNNPGASKSTNSSLPAMAKRIRPLPSGPGNINHERKHPPAMNIQNGEAGSHSRDQRMDTNYNNFPRRRYHPRDDDRPPHGWRWDNPHHHQQQMMAPREADGPRYRFGARPFDEPMSRMGRGNQQQQQQQQQEQQTRDESQQKMPDKNSKKRDNNNNNNKVATPIHPPSREGRQTQPSGNQSDQKNSNPKQQDATPRGTFRPTRDDEGRLFEDLTKTGKKRKTPPDNSGVAVREEGTNNNNNDARMTPSGQHGEGNLFPQRSIRPRQEHNEFSKERRSQHRPGAMPPSPRNNNIQHGQRYERGSPPYPNRNQANFQGHHWRERNAGPPRHDGYPRHPNNDHRQPTWNSRFHHHHHPPRSRLPGNNNNSAILERESPHANNLPQGLQQPCSNGREHINTAERFREKHQDGDPQPKNSAPHDAIGERCKPSTSQIDEASAKKKQPPLSSVSRGKDSENVASKRIRVPSSIERQGSQETVFAQGSNDTKATNMHSTKTANVPTRLNSGVTSLRFNGMVEIDDKNDMEGDGSRRDRSELGSKLNARSSITAKSLNTRIHVPLPEKGVEGVQSNCSSGSPRDAPSKILKRSRSVSSPSRQGPSISAARGSEVIEIDESDDELISTIDNGDRRSSLSEMSTPYLASADKPNEDHPYPESHKKIDKMSSIDLTDLKTRDPADCLIRDKPDSMAKSSTREKKASTNLKAPPSAPTSEVIEIDDADDIVHGGSCPLERPISAVGPQIVSEHRNGAAAALDTRQKPGNVETFHNAQSERIGSRYEKEETAKHDVIGMTDVNDNLTGNTAYNDIIADSKSTSASGRHTENESKREFVDGNVSDRAVDTSIEMKHGKETGDNPTQTISRDDNTDPVETKVRSGEKDASDPRKVVDQAGPTIAATVRPRFRPQKRKAKIARSNTCIDDDKVTEKIETSKQQQESEYSKKEQASKQQKDVQKPVLPRRRNVHQETRYVFHAANAQTSSKRPTKKPHDPKKLFLFDVSNEDAAKKQDRLLRESAARVKFTAKCTVTSEFQHLKPSAVEFSVPVQEIEKFHPNHWKFKNPYSRLGLPKSASLALIKTHYRRLALLYHPDKSRAPDTALKFQEITEAYQTLLDS